MACYIIFTFFHNILYSLLSHDNWCSQMGLIVNATSPIINVLLHVIMHACGMCMMHDCMCT